MRHFVSISFCVLLSVCFANAGFEIVFQDEFDGGNLNDRWNTEVNCDGGGNDELQCYTNNRNENIRQENGLLVIEARHERWENKEFTSARITSKGSWKYGLWEARARLPKGKHLWPAWWAMPARSEYGEWPRSGELDIMEYRGQKPFQTLGTIHFGPNWDQHGMVGSGNRDFPFDFSQDFHVFGCDWNSDRIQWLVDGQVYHEESLNVNFWPGFYNGNGQPYDKEFFVILNLAVGGMFFGGEPFDPNESDGWEKNTYEIDYVRIYEWR